MTSSSATDFRLELSPSLHAVSVAREFVTTHSDSLPPDVIETAVLLVSELVTNAVKHGRPTIQLHVSLAPPLIGVSVHDDGEAIPSTLVRLPAATATSGRGLVIIERLSSHWGVIPSDPNPGKTVWFRLNAPDN